MASSSRIAWTVIVLALTSANPLNLEEMDFTIPTCRDRCGLLEERTTHPCSCDTKCVIFNNCCENMTTDCPHIVTEGLTKFRHLMTSKYICYHTHEFVISSCPQSPTVDDYIMSENNSIDWNRLSRSARQRYVKNPGIDTNRSNESLDLAVTTSSHFSSSVGNVEDNGYSNMEDLIHEIRINTIVTDRSTLISYLNSEIFLCNGGNLSEALKWSAVYDGNEPRSLKDLHFGQNLIFRPDSKRFPTHFHQMPFCDASAIDECLEEKITEQPDLLELCHSFTSYVTRIVFGQVYKNRYCLQCSSNSNSNVMNFNRLYRARNSFSFRVLLSIIANNEIILTNEDSSKQVHDLQCFVSKCSNIYIPGLVNQCKHVTWTCMTFPVAQFLLGRKDLLQLQKFLICSLSKFAKFELGSNFSNAGFLFDSTLNETVYVVCVLVYQSDNFLMNKMDNFEKYVIIIKSLFEYLRMRHFSKPEEALLCNEDISMLNNLTTVYCSVGSDPTLAEVKFERNMNLNSSKVLICHYEGRVNLMPIQLPYFCYKLSIYDSDLVTMAEFTEYGCFSAFEQNETSDLDIPYFMMRKYKYGQNGCFVFYEQNEAPDCYIQPYFFMKLLLVLYYIQTYIFPF